MRRLVFAFAALAALCHVSTARASDPGVSWYGANSSWNGGDIGVSYFEYESAEGNPNEMAFGIAEDGSFSGVAWQAFNDVFSGDPQMTMAITALEKSLKAQVMAKNIATGLDNLAVVATDAGGSEVAVKVVRSDAVSTGGKPVSTADSFDARPKVDGRTLSKAADGRLSMFGADTATSSEDDFFAYPEFFVPALFKGDGHNLCWLRYGGWDGSALSLVERGDGAKALTLAGWHGGATNECGSTVAEILTEEDGANRKAHSVLTRYDDGSGPVFHYVPFGDRVEASAKVDGVTLAKDEKEGTLSLAGWDYGAKGPLFLANVGGAPAYLPVEGGGGGCGCTNAWAALADWIGDGTESGGTNGVEFADESLYRTIIHAGFIDQVDDLSLGRTYNEKTDRDTISIKGFAEGDACDASLTAMLAATNSVDAAGHLLLTRHSSGELHYLPLGAAEFDRLGPTLKFVGTDPENVAVVPGSSETNTVTFASAWDSNVKVTVERDGANGVKVTFGVYYK